jgi:hypothetical protein
MTALTPALAPDLAARFARIALGHVAKEYPHKLDHVLTADEDAQTPRALHPIFFGSFDWHSCVHGYWLLARLYRLYPQGEAAAQIAAQLDLAFTPENGAAEAAYLKRPMSAGFERPYGWGWALALVAELSRHESPEGHRWHGALRPLGEAFSDRFVSYLPKAVYPVRAGVHSNTAFALLLAIDYARAVGDDALGALACAKVRDWYGADRDCQAWEPDGDAFLSPALTEAAVMSQVLDGEAFAHWFDGFLPRLSQRAPATLFTPATVSDRTDGKIAHLDGLNLSRGWCFGLIAAALPEGHAALPVCLEAREQHLASALAHVAGDYMGEHWLASFALLALETNP